MVGAVLLATAVVCASQAVKCWFALRAHIDRCVGKTGFRGVELRCQPVLMKAAGACGLRVLLLLDLSTPMHAQHGHMPYRAAAGMLFQQIIRTTTP